jgi:SAM-dependent methyltransferase
MPPPPKPSLLEVPMNVAQRSPDGPTGATTQAVASVFHEILESRLPAFDPWLYDYCGHLESSASAEKFLRHLDDRLAFGGFDPHGKSVLDAGSGFGFALVALAMRGAAEVHGLEIYEPMLDTMRAYLPLVPDEARSRIQLSLGDVSAMPYAEESFDAILSFEAISHYRDLPDFIHEAHRVLRPGGVLIVSDGNNGLNPLKRHETRKLWDAFERGPRGSRVGRIVVEHDYEDERRQFVATAYPDVPAERMARQTFGYTFDDVAAACERYRLDRSFPGSTYDRGTAPLNPADGTLIEQLFNPYALARQMRSSGFTTRVRGYWGGASGRRSIRLANSILSVFSPITIVTASSFLIAARKAA